jgi:acyl-homoserine lactone acylase PvdQ
VRRVLAAVAVAAGLALGLGASTAAPPRDYAAVALDVLPPGQAGGLALTRNSTDQLRLYDGLTPRFDQVSAADLRRYFKAEPFGLDGARPVRVESPRAGLKIQRDRWDVPHVYGRTRADVEFGAGWVTAEDRGLLMNLLRGPGRIAALDVPGVDAFGLVGSGRNFEPSPQTEAFLAEQVKLLEGAGAKGRQLLRDADAYIAGINAYNRQAGLDVRPWSRNDVVAVAALIGAVFGKGGGDEVARSEYLSALIDRFGDVKKALEVWRDLREENDPETPVSVDGTFPTYQAPAGPPGDSLLTGFQPVTFGPSGYRPPLRMSNAVLVGAKRSATGHPLFVAGPQVGYYYPEILLEVDLHGGGIDARGAAFPGVSLYVLIGRGKDYAWSATSAGTDVVDDFAEQLCGDDTHYFVGTECREMGTFDAGILRGKQGEPDRRLVFRTTVHGPVIGYATAGGGKRVALAQARSTRGRELLSAFAFQDLSTNRITSARSFLRAMNQVEFTFNWFYADDRDIAMFSSGRIPLRAPGVELGLPTPGPGSYEWRGFLTQGQHVQGIDPRDGTIVNWNNKPGLGLPAADDNWGYGSVHRVQLLDEAIGSRAKLTLPQVVGAMNRAATQDLRAVRVLPSIASVLQTAPPPNARDGRLLDLLLAWRASGASRLDRDLDGKVDDPGAAIMDAAWPRLAKAVLAPVLGPLVDRLPRLIPVDDPPSNGGSAYFSGWYGYVDKDLRDLLARTQGRPPPAGALSTLYCGGGEPAACRASLWAALEAAADELAAKQGSDPAAWRADATAERIGFSGFMPDTMRWANRPTFQQVITFARHRPR